MIILLFSYYLITKEKEQPFAQKSKICRLNIGDLLCLLLYRNVMALANIMTIDIFKTLKRTDIKNLLIVLLHEIKICICL